MPARKDRINSGKLSNTGIGSIESPRLELANAYATWWNVSQMEPDEYSNPANYKAGAPQAKRRAIELYQEYIKAQKTAGVEVRKRLKALQKNPMGSNERDYFCEDYED